MQVKLRGSVSSQYLTALLMAAPLAEAPGGIDIVTTDELVSQPYVAMTVGLMASFGVEVLNPLLGTIFGVLSVLKKLSPWHIRFYNTKR